MLCERCAPTPFSPPRPFCMGFVARACHQTSDWSIIWRAAFRLNGDSAFNWRAPQGATERRANR
jgi:hypothetical protein